MKVDLKVKGLDELLGKLGRFPEQVEKVTERVLKQAGRAVAVEAGQITGKGGLGEGQGAKQEKKIAAEIRSVYPSKDQGGRIYKLIKEKDEVLAKQFYAAYKSKDEKLAQALLRKARVPRNLDEGAHRKLRRSGGVKFSAVPFAVVAPGRQRGYIARQQKLVGLVKGGWFVAGKSLGGRQRTRTAEGKDVQAFPGYVRRHGRRSGIGGSRYTGGRKASLRIWNSVRHIGEVMPPSLQRQAVGGMGRRLAKAFAAELKYLNGKKSKR